MQMASSLCIIHPLSFPWSYSVRVRTVHSASLQDATITMVCIPVTALMEIFGHGVRQINVSIIGPASCPGGCYRVSIWHS